MIDSFQISDFDFLISDILLVHKNTFVHFFKWNEYRFGRNIDGITYCISGRASFDFGSRSFEVHPGQLVFLPASSSYVVRCESDEPYIHYTVNFRFKPEFGKKFGREDAVCEYCEPTAFSEIIAGRICHITSPENAEIYSEPFGKLLSVWQSKRNGYRVMAKSLLYELLYLYFTDAGRSYRNKDDYNKLLPARKTLDTDYSAALSVSELAALCSMSETHFRRLFYRVFGVSPTEYRLQKRILRAKDLLLSGQYSVAETAREVGFSDPNYFTRVFRAQVGISPSEFMNI